MLNILTAITSLATGYFERKAEEKQAKHAAKLEVIRQGGAWEEIQAEASKDSWKDEFWTVVFSIPLIMIFVGVAIDPELIAKTEQAFEVLERLPDWYQYLLFMAVSASFGIRGADKLMKLRNKK
jgi:hypothetical protein